MSWYWRNCMEEVRHCVKLELSQQCRIALRKRHCVKLELSQQCRIALRKRRCVKLELSQQCRIALRKRHWVKLELSQQCRIALRKRHWVKLELSQQCRIALRKRHCVKLELSQQCRIALRKRHWVKLEPHQSCRTELWKGDLDGPPQSCRTRWTLDIFPWWPLLRNRNKYPYFYIYRHEFGALVINTNIRTVGFCVKTVIILQWKCLCVPDCIYTSMFINFIQMSLYNVSPMQVILYEFKRVVVVWKRL